MKFNGNLGKLKLNSESELLPQALNGIISS